MHTSFSVGYETLNLNSMSNSERPHKLIDEVMSEFESFITQQCISDGLQRETLILIRQKISLLHLEVLRILEAATAFERSEMDSQMCQNKIHININVGSTPNVSLTDFDNKNIENYLSHVFILRASKIVTS